MICITQDTKCLISYGTFNKYMKNGIKYFLYFISFIQSIVCKKDNGYITYTSCICNIRYTCL